MRTDLKGLGQRSLRRNVIMSWLVTVVTAVLSFALIPIVVGTLDTEVYGVWTFLNGLAAYSSLLYLGLGAAFLRRLSQAAALGNIAAAERLLGVAWTMYAGLGAICLALCLGLSPVIPRVFAAPLSPDAARAASITTALVGVRLFFGFTNSSFSALLSAHGRMDLAHGVALFSAVARSAAVVWAMTQPTPLIALAVVTTIDVFVQAPILMTFGRLAAPSVRLRPALPTREELADLYGFGVQAFFVQASLLIISYTDTALIGVLLGAASVSLYAVPLQLVEYSRLLVNGVTTALLPEVAGLHVQGDKVSLKRLFLRASRACGAISVFINVHLLTLGPAFLGMWVGSSFRAEAPEILWFLCLAATGASISTQVLTPFYQAFNLLKVLVLIILTEAALNLVLSVWLARAVGLWGVALGSAVPALAVTALLGPRYMLAVLSIGRKEYWHTVLRPVLTLALVTAGTQLALSAWLGAESYGVMAVRVMCSALASAPVIAAMFPREDWSPIVLRVFPRLGTHP